MFVCLHELACSLYSKLAFWIRGFNSSHRLLYNNLKDLKSRLWKVSKQVELISINVLKSTIHKSILHKQKVTKQCRDNSQRISKHSKEGNKFLYSLSSLDQRPSLRAGQHDLKQSLFDF